MKKRKPPASRFAGGIVTLLKRSRFNPISSLTPETLSAQLNAFASGYLGGFAMSADAIRRRDDMINPALSKREKAPARRRWAVQLVEGLDESQEAEAENHREALQFLYDNIEVTAALEQNQTGGMRLLVRQMMQAESYKYAIHEVVWVPTVDPRTNQPRLTAKLTHAPLWLFENTTGRLRFLQGVFGGTEGVPMERDEWLVTVGEGIMEALAVCWMFKQMSLKDWVSYNDKYGMPGIHAETDATEDSPAWNEVVTAVEEFSQEWSAVTGGGTKFNILSAAGGQGVPFQPLVERMDRAIATICRGADLSTISAGQGSGQGASLQGEETELLEMDDAQMITEALESLSKAAIRQLFGVDKPLAYVQIVVPKKKSTDEAIKKMEFLGKHGVAVGVAYARQELDVPTPSEDEELLKAPAPVATPFGFNPGAFTAANSATKADARLEIFRAQASRRLGRAQADALRPLTDRLSEILGIEDEAAQDAALLKLQNDLPNLLKSISADEDLIRTWEEILGTALVGGAADAATAQKQSTTTARP